MDRAVMIAPMLGVARARGAWSPVAARLLGAMPNAFVWWDAKLKRELRGPRHVYPRFATRAVAAVLTIGWAVREDALQNRPACRSLAMITVGGDLAVDNGLNAEVVTAWRRHRGRLVEAYEFPVALHLSHDVVDPEQVGGNPGVTYPVLVRMIGR